jgi:hypothetical protein
MQEDASRGHHSSRLIIFQISCNCVFSQTCTAEETRSNPKGFSMGSGKRELFCIHFTAAVAVKGGTNRTTKRRTYLPLSFFKWDFAAC